MNKRPSVFRSFPGFNVGWYDVHPTGRAGKVHAFMFEDDGTEARNGYPLCGANVIRRTEWSDIRGYRDIFDMCQRCVHSAHKIITSMSPTARSADE